MINIELICDFLEKPKFINEIKKNNKAEFVNKFIFNLKLKMRNSYFLLGECYLNMEFKKNEAIKHFLSANSIHISIYGENLECQKYQEKIKQSKKFEENTKNLKTQEVENNVGMTVI